MEDDEDDAIEEIARPIEGTGGDNDSKEGGVGIPTGPPSADKSKGIKVRVKSSVK